MAEFNYNDAIADADAVSAVVAQMTGSGLPQLSDEEREQRRIEHETFLAESYERDRQQRFEYEQKRLAAAEAERAEAERQAAIARAETTKQLREETDRRNNRLQRDRTLTSLLDASIRQEAFRNHAVRAATFQNKRSRLSAALDNAIATRYPPPPPEPTIVYMPEDDGSADLGSRNFDVAKWSKKPRSWW